MRFHCFIYALQGTFLAAKLFSEISVKWRDLIDGILTEAYT
jgi:hypothetical protein